MVVGLLLAAVLFVLGVGTTHRQFRTLRRLREERFLPAEDRTYFLAQARRRLAISAALVVLGGMIGGYYVSGMDARMDAIPKKKEDAPQPPPEPDPEQVEANKQFTKFAGYYLIALLLVVFVVVCLAVFDFRATRKYWMARYREIKADHEAKLQRDLAVYRQARENDRMNRLRGRRREGDPDPDDTPPPD